MLYILKKKKSCTKRKWSLAFLTSTSENASCVAVILIQWLVYNEALIKNKYAEIKILICMLVESVTQYRSKQGYSIWGHLWPHSWSLHTGILFLALFSNTEPVKSTGPALVSSLSSPLELRAQCWRALMGTAAGQRLWHSYVWDGACPHG